MQAPKVAPPDMICRDKFLVQSTYVPEGTKEEDVTSNMFVRDGKVVDEKRLKVILISPPDSPESSPINETLKIVQKDDAREVKDEFVQKHTSHSKLSSPVKGSPTINVTKVDTNSRVKNRGQGPSLYQLRPRLIFTTLFFR
ncbi:uncharacterized protein LOC111881605 [Lactuca sativa]|uniref:MSP domain-containing protein n=1 Tax=Lactuca sativa TaxID=4236 RepID=A0A9R1VY99_LACSA|nr:uncharacterized protein LOC111881605 [Lactuca sativa]KAJ0213147.1 hypothetical protein LSAT_V11C400202940 [Lactuca sativa]